MPAPPCSGAPSRCPNICRNTIRFFRASRATRGDCQFTFIQFPGGAQITAQFRERLDRAFAAFGLRAADHCVFLPRLEQQKFVAAIGACDAVLDSIGWSGCNSMLESLVHDLPIVTLTGPLMRGRHATAILKMMDMPETIAASIDGYVAAAVRIARDGAWRSALRTRSPGTNIGSIATAIASPHWKIFCRPGTPSRRRVDRHMLRRGMHGARYKDRYKDERWRLRMIDVPLPIDMPAPPAYVQSVQAPASPLKVVPSQTPATGQSQAQPPQAIGPGLYPPERPAQAPASAETEPDQIEVTPLDVGR